MSSTLIWPRISVAVWGATGAGYFIRQANLTDDVASLRQLHLILSVSLPLKAGQYLRIGWRICLGN
jgi:hypothetical protein